MSKNDTSKSMPVAKLKRLTHKNLGDKVPRRGGSIAPPIARRLFKLMGWKAVGEIPNVPKAVFLALPHTSNFDGVYAIPLVLGLDLDINIMGKDSLFKYPVLARFLSGPVLFLLIVVKKAQSYRPVLIVSSRVSRYIWGWLQRALGTTLINGKQGFITLLMALRYLLFQLLWIIRPKRFAF